MSGSRPLEAQELIDAALRVLKKVRLKQQPDADDVSIIRSYALPEESHLTVYELGCELIKREIAKRRTFRRSWA